MFPYPKLCDYILNTDKDGIYSVVKTHLVEPKKISTRKTQKFQRLPGFLRPIFEVGKKDIKKRFGKISGPVPLPKAF